MSVSNAQRAQLRRLIGAHSGWAAYRRLHGLGDTSSLGSALCLQICATLQIDHSHITGNTPMPAPTAPNGLFNRAAAAPAAAPQPHVFHGPAPVTAPSVQAAMDALLAALSAQAGDSAAVAALAADLETVTARVQTLESAAPALLVVDAAGLAFGDELPSTRHPMMETLIRSVTARDLRGTPQNVWISGPTGSGKTTGARMAAEALGLAWGFHSQMQMPHELLGFVDAAGTYHETVFVRLFRDGGLCLLDEIDGWAVDATAALNSALANGQISLPTGEIIDRHPNFHCIGAGNTWGLGPTAEFVGRNRLDAATRSRFPIKLAWGYDQALERALAQNDAWADRVFAARRAAEKHGIKTLIDPRVTIAGAALIRCGFSSDEAAANTYLAELAPAQAALVEGR